MGRVIVPWSREHMKQRKPLALLAYWIQERERIRILKESGAPLPWTMDPILRGYRFCNVHREDDRVTRWIDRHWRKPHAEDPRLWFSMAVARFINWPDTLEEIGYPTLWLKTRNKVKATLHARQDRGEKVFTGAYIVSTNGAPMGKIDYVIGLFDRIWACSVPPTPNDSLAEAHAALMRIKGIGSFMAAQIVADLKNTPYLANASDWWDWAAPGPGSLRGLSRVRGIGTGSTWQKAAFLPELLTLREELDKEGVDTSTLCLQDLQNCLCEFDKYCRVLHQQGRPRATYTQGR